MCWYGPDKARVLPEGIQCCKVVEPNDCMVLKDGSIWDFGSNGASISIVGTEQEWTGHTASRPLLVPTKQINGMADGIKPDMQHGLLHVLNAKTQDGVRDNTELYFLGAAHLLHNLRVRHLNDQFQTCAPTAPAEAAKVVLTACV